MENQSPQYGVTIDEVMDYLKTNVPTKEDLKELEQKFDRKLDVVKHELMDYTDTSLGKMKHELMDYTDTRSEKLRFDIQGDIVTQSRKEDAKLVGLIEILEHKNIITDREAKTLLGMEPFPRAHV